MIFWRFALLAFPLAIFLFSFTTYPEDEREEIMEAAGIEEGGPKYAEAVAIASSQRGVTTIAGKVKKVEDRGRRLAEIELENGRKMMIYVDKSLVEGREMVGKNVTIYGVAVKSGKVLGKAIVIEEEGSCIAKKKAEEKCRELLRRRH